MEITTIHTIDTEYSADSIEWCPHPDFSTYFVCGTYQLEGDNTESTSPPCRRKGRIYLFSFDPNTKSLKELHRIETAAILDMKWLQHSMETPLLAAANALGQIETFELKDDKLHLRSYLDLNPEYHNLLTLSLDWSWSNGNEQAANINCRRILASDSKGDISIINYNPNDGHLEKEHSWVAHSFEAWICAFDKWNENVVYTGGDDSFMHAYDLRTYERIFTNKSHIAGVTCFLSHPKKENILLTGSYDERLRIFDTRSLKQPLGELNLNGGIWRLKSDPLDRNLILAACMYQNFSIVKLSGEDNHVVNLVGEYNEHKSICYGADWCLNPQPNEKDLYMATCSFYDHKLCIAKVSEKLKE